MTDPEGWQKPMWGAVSGPERLEERQGSLAAWNRRAQAVRADAVDVSLGAYVSLDMRAIRSEVRGKPKRGGLPLSRRRLAISAGTTSRRRACASSGKNRAVSV